MKLSGLSLVAPFPGVFIRRSVAYWALLHGMRALIMAFAASLAKQPLPPTALLPGGNPLVVALTIGLGMLEARRRDEDLYLANLGYGWPAIALYLAFPATALEAAFTVARFGWGMLAAYAALPLAGLRAVFAS
ncbi:MAG TPA: hypothetical protein VF665_07245 [Longimicrobium sp.]|jgi:hypothetical protein|uniref:hypothetical protein n=1 Tax=Longimicrobium sp. TaxID=2029185 RepID=UPI002ED8EE46